MSNGEVAEPQHERHEGHQPDAARPPQFSLRTLFALMTGVAIASGLAAWKGVGTLPHSLGILLASFNVTGHLAPVQTGRIRPRVFYLAWLLFFASLVLPAAKGCNGPDIRGWQAAWASVAIEYSILASPFSESLELWDNEGPGLVLVILYYTMLNLANLLMLLSPVLLFRLQRGAGRRYGSVLAVCATVSWFVSWESEGYLIGYYVWCLSFAAIVSACRLTWRTFAMMIALSAFLVSMACLY